MKKIFKSIACCCLSLAIAIACCFGAMKMSKNQRFLGTSCNKASAYVSDTPVVDLPNITIYNSSFYSSNIFWSRIALHGPSFSNDFSTTIEGGSAFYPFYDTFFLWNFSLGSTNSKIDFNASAVQNSSVYLSNLDNYFNVGSFSFNSIFNSYNNSLDISLSDYSSNIRCYHPSLSGLAYTTLGYALYKPFDSFNGSFVYPSLVIDKIEMFSTFEFHLYYPDFSIPFEYCNIVAYTDTTGYTFFYFLPSIASDFSRTSYLSYRYYYVNLDFTDNDYYKQGLQQGYDNGYSQGETDGYNNGYSQGRTEGYNNGYTQGLESSERLGFPALITSVIDIPVKVFTSLFNFDILGVNILTFITSLLTIALILAIVRKVKSD